MSKRSCNHKTGYSVEQKIQAVKQHLETQVCQSAVAEQLGVSTKTIGVWVRTYKTLGAKGFEPQSTLRSRCPDSSVDPVASEIINHKIANPDHGIKRIAQTLCRWLGITVTPHKVHETLKSEGLIEERPKRRVKNDSKPRFFERATPNQLWQTDIMTFRLAGQNAYLIGFMDDYSRYLVGLGVYRSQTAENVLETFKTALGEYGIPRELLSDNGRQYYSWRGKTRFVRLLETHRIKHIRSQPHHPMTCGKIERFWSTVQEEFLFKCQFDSFENFRERLDLWVKYYNFKRPHQGIGGMCPADRFFEINHELKATLSKTVEENIQELALRGRLKKTFYMVGRMGDQNVAIRAEKGKLTMHLDDPERPEGRQLQYDLNAEDATENLITMELDENEPKHETSNRNSSDLNIHPDSPVAGSDSNNGTVNSENSQLPPPVYGAGEMPSGAESVVDEPKCKCDLPGDGDSAAATRTLGGSGVVGDDACAGGASPGAGKSTGQASETSGGTAEPLSGQADQPGKEIGISSGKTNDHLTFVVNGSNLSITI